MTFPKKKKITILAPMAKMYIWEEEEEVDDSGYSLHFGNAQKRDTSAPNTEKVAYRILL